MKQNVADEMRPLLCASMEIKGCLIFDIAFSGDDEMEIKLCIWSCVLAVAHSIKTTMISWLTYLTVSALLVGERCLVEDDWRALHTKLVNCPERFL